jgi:uncharacterized membrane protein
VASESGTPREEPPIPEHVGHKVHKVSALFAEAEGRVGRHQLAIERVTSVLGRPATAYSLAVVILGWLLANGLAPRVGVRALDPPPFSYLQVAVSIAALLTTVIIVTAQNRVDKLAQQRAHLDLQVNLIAEEKIAKLIALIEELRHDIPSVKNRRDSLAEAMTEAVDLHAVAGGLAPDPEDGTPHAGGT